jgi:hypothetical protein
MGVNSIVPACPQAVSEPAMTQRVYRDLVRYCDLHMLDRNIHVPIFE